MHRLGGDGRINKKGLNHTLKEGDSLEFGLHEKAAKILHGLVCQTEVVSDIVTSK